LRFLDPGQPALAVELNRASSRREESLHDSVTPASHAKRGARVAQGLPRTVLSAFPVQLT